MIIHSYFTEGYYPWAEFFIRTLKRSNGEENKLIMSSRNLNKKRINSLKKLYKNIEVRNKDLDYKQMAKEAQVSEERLMVMKTQMETVKINKNNWVWKLMVSAEDRIREIREVLLSLEDGENMLNLDIDTYIRRPLDPWFDIVKENDFTSIFRIEKQMRKFGFLKKKAYLIICCVQGYTVNDRSRKFMDAWIKHIVSMKAPDRPKGWGQITCWRAYEEMKDELSCGSVPEKSHSLTGVGKDKIIWGANKGSKTENLARFKQDFNR